VWLVRELHAFPENARGVLRHDGVDVETGAPFESRGLREPRRDLEMPVVLGLLAVAGGRVDVIVEGRIVEDAEHSTQDVFEDAGERGALVVRDVFEGHLMGLREDPGLEREPGRIGGKADERLVFRDDPLLFLELRLDDFAIEAGSPGRLVESIEGIDLLHDPTRHDRRRNELRVRMGDRCARALAVVLEDQDVLEPLVADQVEVPLLVRGDDLLHLEFALHGQVVLVLRGLDDDLVRSHAVHAVE